MAQFRHYILTRFNVGLYDPSADLRVSPEQWMEHRLRLFRALTLPSIAGQSCQDFTWLVLVDRQTPEHYLSALEGIGYANMRLIYPAPAGSPWLKHYAPGQYDLITTRIDNDDAFHCDAVKTIQHAWRAEHAGRAKPWVIVFPFGIVLDLAGPQAWVMEYWFNNCPSLVEDSETHETIMQWDHSQIPDAVGKCHVTDKPYWLQVIHSQNLRNAIETDNPSRIVHKELPVRPEHLRQFGIEPGRLPEA